MIRAFAAVVWSATVVGCASQAPPPERNEVDFKTVLSRRGEWLVVRPYGRVWHPHEKFVGPSFVPYLSGGHWKYGKDGWEFESEWAWAYFTSHYGRWFLGQDLGWVWFPDQEYAASWVEWRFGSDFVGWSPVPPPGMAGARLAPEPQRWTFVKTRHFTQADLFKHLLPPEALPRALETAPPVAGRRGPDVEQVRAQGGLTSDGGVPDLRPPPEPEPPAVVAPPEEKQEEPPPATPPKKKKKHGKRGR